MGRLLPEGNPEAQYLLSRGTIEKKGSSGLIKRYQWQINQYFIEISVVTLRHFSTVSTENLFIFSLLFLPNYFKTVTVA